MNPTLTSFDFTEFARNIYQETPELHEQSFLLPALYGGESGQSYEALFVLEAPSVSFTEKRWSPCNTIEEAIQKHRAVFFEWAFSGKQAHLFRSFAQMAFGDSLLSQVELTTREFFRRFYVTDVWKDALFNTQRGNRRYKDYWLSKLAIELEKVPTQRVIFIGRQAEQGGKLFIRSGFPTHYVPFPSRWLSEEIFKTEVARLTEEIRATKT